MYHKIGDKELAKSIYKNNNFTEFTKFFHFETDNEVKLFTDYIILNNFYSSFYLPEEDVEFANKAGLKNFQYDHAMKVFDYFNKSIEEIEEPYKVE